VSQKQLWDVVDANTDLKIVMAHDNINYNLRDIFGLTIVENERLTQSQYDNIFIMKPFSRRSIITQFNTLGLEKFVRILSGSESDLKSMDEVKAKNGNKPEEWLPEFYKILEK
jgi:type IV secretory pathway VirB4 component